MEYVEISAKTVNDAITEACKRFTVTSNLLDYEVIEEGSTGFLGFNAKPAIIKVRVKEEEPVEEIQEIFSEHRISDKTEQIVFNQDVEALAKSFLSDVFKAMNLKVTIDAKYNEESKYLDIDLSGDEMGVLIGKRGQTLDSVQYLVSLVINKGTSEYIRVKVDTENYRQRRKETLENLAKNISYKVKRTKRSVSLEPMNPYERRIIHSALQNDRYVTTHSEGEEPFRRVVVSLKRG